MTAVIYARYSSDNQREESIEGQIRECTAFAEKNGMDDKAIEAIVFMAMDLQGRENTNLSLYEQWLQEAQRGIDNLLNAIQ